MGVHGNDKARRSEGAGFSRRGFFPPHQLGGPRQRCKFPQWGPGKTQATWRFRTFYRLTKPLREWICRIHGKFLVVPISICCLHSSEIFVAVRATEDRTTKFLWCMGSEPMLDAVANTGGSLGADDRSPRASHHGRISQ